jgi:regulator of PEP synthase PpsR (kinase-PPPase family)
MGLFVRDDDGVTTQHLRAADVVDVGTSNLTM